MTTMQVEVFLVAGHKSCSGPAAMLRQTMMLQEESSNDKARASAHPWEGLAVT
jgi:hypothetical protein